MKSNFGIALLAIIALTACQKQEDASQLKTTKKAVAAVMLGTGEIIPVKCLLEGKEPEQCERISKTSRSSDEAANRAATGERGAYSPYGWFGYYQSPNYSTYTYYFSPTDYVDFCKQVLGIKKATCNKWLKWTGADYKPTKTCSACGYQPFQGGNYNSFNYWQQSLGGWGSCGSGSGSSSCGGGCSSGQCGAYPQPGGWFWY